MEGWQEECKRYVAILDIMGFKDMVFRNDHTELKEQIKELLDFKDTVLDLMGESESEDIEELETIIYDVTFSDSLIFITKDESYHNFKRLLSVLRAVQKSSFQLNLPTKGAISYGLFSLDFDNSLFLGQPLIDAYLLQEELYYYGIILDNDVESKIYEFMEASNKREKDLKSHLVKSDKTPLKSCSATHYNLKVTQLGKDEIKGMYKGVSGSTRKYVDNTLMMFDEMHEKKPFT